MSEKTLTRMDLSEAVFREVGLSRNESANLVESVLQHMSDALAAGETVKISSFGTFAVRSKSARIGRKMGHFNVLAESEESALQQANSLKEALRK